MWHTTIYFTPESAKVVSLGKVIFGAESKFKNIVVLEVMLQSYMRLLHWEKKSFKRILENLEAEKEFDC